MPSLEELLRKAELQATEHYDAWLRAKAEADNIRKRAQADIANAHKFAVENFSVRAAGGARQPGSGARRAERHAGIHEERRRADAAAAHLRLRALSIRELNPVGEKFDPHRHQAMTMVESDAPPNTVVQVLQKGYLLHDRVLRPALVVGGEGPRSLNAAPPIPI